MKPDSSRVLCRFSNDARQSSDLEKLPCSKLKLPTILRADSQASSPLRDRPFRCRPYLERKRRYKPCSPSLRSKQEIFLRRYALSAARRGDYAGAIASYTQLLRHNPTNAVDYNNRGLAYFHAKQFELALANYDTALALNPYLDSAYNNRANYYAAQGEFLEAILDYDIALDLNPGNVRAWINQGITFRDLQMYDRALENFESALKMEQWLGHIYAERGRTYHLRGDWNCAVADYQRAIAYLPALTPNPTNPSGRLRLQVEMWFDELLLPVFENTSCD